MSNLVIDSDTSAHQRPHHITKLRILGMILEYNALEGYVLVQPVISLTENRKPLKLILDDNLQLDNPELCYTGTAIDAVCLDNGDLITILDIRVIDGGFTKSERATLHAISKIKSDPL